MLRPAKVFLFATLFAFNGLPAQEQEAEESLSLPDWQQQEVVITPLGGGLLPERPADAAIVSSDTMVDGSIPVAPPVDEADSNMEVVDRDFFHHHGAPTAFAPITDPGAVLEQSELEEVHQLLVDHALSARVSVRLVILSSQQKLPDHADLHELGIANHPNEENATALSCLVVYPMGEPWRVRMFMSRAITQAVPAQDLGGMAQASIKEAVKTSLPEDQLRRFISELFIRLTWMERSYTLPTAHELTPEITELVSDAAPITMTEHATFVDRLWLMIKPFAWKAVGVLVLILAAFMAVRSIRKRLRRRAKVSVWILPDPRIEPRLGGKYCGSGGVSVKY